MIEADFVLSLVSAIRPDGGHRRRWYPELCFYAKNAPRFLSLASSEQEALNMAQLFESQGIAELQEKLRAGFEKLNAYRSKDDRRSFNFSQEIDAIASRR
jgi:hypothetical protein